MKKTILLLIFAFTLYNCQNKTTPDTETVGQHIEIANLDQYERFGEIFNVTEVLTTKEMQQRLTNLKVGDTLDVIFEGNVKEVCQKKGCWMKVDLGNEEAFVRFTDYGYFVPKDASHAQAILKGKAFIQETSVEELRHYAQDAGQSDEEIAAIISPKIEYNFMADGVMLKNQDEKLD